MVSKTQCPFCAGNAELFFTLPQKVYHRCRQCLGLFLDPACFISKQVEKSRYQEHNNDVCDPRYQQFVEPILEKVQARFTPKQQGLDYGAGTGPVVAKILRDQGYSIQLYDPYFHNYPCALERKYDFIICCEVIEHFNDPAQEFARLRALLKPGGALFCMTDLYSENIDFKKWYYKDDPTHVFFYSEKTLFWIKKKFNFLSLEHDDRMVSFIT